ncbi:MAG TPA: phospholipase D-like domain-containing protein [Mucilaginibacter sp.]
MPSSYHHVNDVFFGAYTYEITPRYLAGNVLQPIDPTLTVAVTIQVCPFNIKSLQIGFTRSFIASQAAASHFGEKVKLKPDHGDPGFQQLLYDTRLNSGHMQQMINGVLTDVPYSYDDLYSYLGWQVRARVIDFLEEALKDPEISLDVFAFDLDEPTICQYLLTMAGQGRIRIILDNSTSHVTQPGVAFTQFEDQFTNQFNATKTGNADIKRGCFFSLAHSKVFIQLKNNQPVKVLTGSTNFSVNGLYVNANNVLIFNNPSVAALYEKIFDASWPDTKAFKANTDVSAQSFGFNSPAEQNNINDPTLPQMVIRFSPHPKTFAQKELDDLAADAETAQSILFAIMNDRSGSALLTAIMGKVRHTETFTMGITDSTTEVLLYSPNSTTGIHVAGRGLRPLLPSNFKPEPTIEGISVHHKFVVLNFNTDNGIVICGSSNLALGPEQENGDNLLVIRDPDVVTVFGIEAIRLVDHFQFRDKSNKAGGTGNITLHTDSLWTKAYFTDGDMKSRERLLLTADQPNQ